MTLDYTHFTYNDYINKIEDILPLVNNEWLQTYFGETLDQQVMHHAHNQIDDAELVSRLFDLLLALKELDLADPDEFYS